MSLKAFSLLRLPDVASPERAQDAIRHGFKPETLRTLAERYQVSLETIGRLAGIPKSSLTRKLRTKRRLDASEADRVYRLARIYALARDVLESDHTARAWFATPNRALGGSKPIDLLDTEIGAGRVERVLEQIEYSVLT